jgi:hypothetical protein
MVEDVPGIISDIWDFVSGGIVEEEIERAKHRASSGTLTKAKAKAAFLVGSTSPDSKEPLGLEQDVRTQIPTQDTTE